MPEKKFSFWHDLILEIKVYFLSRATTKWHILLIISRCLYLHGWYNLLMAVVQVYLLDVLAVLLRSTMLNIMINGQAVSIFQVLGTRKLKYYTVL